MLWAPRNARVKSGYLCLNPFWAARLLKSYSPSSPSSSSSSSSTSSPPHRRSRSSGGRATGPQDLHRLVRGGRRREGCRRAHDRVLSRHQRRQPARDQPGRQTNVAQLKLLLLLCALMLCPCGHRGLLGAEGQEYPVPTTTGSFF